MRLGLKRGITALGIVVAIAGCSGDDDSSTGEPSSTAPPVASSAPAELPGVIEYFETSQDHVDESVDYAVSPPVGGAHFAVWQNCGFYDEPVVDEVAVHALEHGAVWLTYNDSIDSDTREALIDLAAAQTHVLVSPYEHEAPLVMTAWNRQQVLAEVDGDAVVAFVELYQQGPQTPEPGAPCDGGEGQPLG